MVAVLAMSLLASEPALFAQNASGQRPDSVTIRGTVLSAAHKLVDGAVVRLERTGTAVAYETKTDASGAFVISIPGIGSYTAIAEKSGLHSRAVALGTLSAGKQTRLELVLEDSGGAAQSSLDAMEFSDKPNFTVAGVVDWTAVGGHGSDATLRTSEALARETVALKAGNSEHRPASSTEADQHRLAGEWNEKRGDPLGAVHEFEQAVRLEPSEENYFAWGSELLLHRAVWQAQEVLGKAALKYPKSARIQTGLGTALFAGAHYDEAASRFCEASDLNPKDADAYTLLGKVEMAAPAPLPCVEKKLAQYAEAHPENSLANYFYAMVLLKRQEQPANAEALQRVETLLTKAVTADNKCGDAYFHLGVLSVSRRDLDGAIGYYRKAIEANPELGEAHYRLGVAYDRKGEPVKAKQEFEIHDALEKRQADAIEEQRRDLKQFLIVLQGQPGSGKTN